MGIEKRFASYLDAAILRPKEKLVAPNLNRAMLKGGDAPKHYSPNQDELGLTVLYQQGDERARQAIIGRTYEQKLFGHCGKEGPLGGPSHFQWWGIARAAQRIITIERDDEEMLEASDWWWGSTWALCERFWQPSYGKRGGVLYVGPRAWSDAHGGKGRGQPGDNPYLSDGAGVVLFGQQNRINQGGAEPDTTLMRLWKKLLDMGDEIGSTPVEHFKPPKLQAPIYVCREGSNTWQWWEPPPGVTGPILYALAIREGGRHVDWYFEPTKFGKEATEVIGA